MPPELSVEFVLTRKNSSQVAETKARSMEEEVSKLQKCLQDKDEQLRSSTCSTEQVKISLSSPIGFGARSIN